MFYSDSTMHQIYIDDGSFNISYQLPQMVYSFIISSIFENLLNLLGLYEGDIFEFNNNKNKNKNIKKILYNINCKIALFLALSVFIPSVI